MFAFVSLTASAQGIKSGSKWNISNLVYEAKVNTDKTITFTAMAEGEELAFRLTPSNSKKNEYVLSEDQNADSFNPFRKTPRAEYLEKASWKLICLHDQKRQSAQCARRFILRRRGEGGYGQVDGADHGQVCRWLW